MPLASAERSWLFLFYIYTQKLCMLVTQFKQSEPEDHCSGSISTRLPVSPVCACDEVEKNIHNKLQNIKKKYFLIMI